MPKVKYVEKRFSHSSLLIIQSANDIIDEYTEQGFSLTLRQLYYQFVSRDLIPNRQSEYKKLGVVINDARLAGLIDWNAIEDRTRNVRSLSHWNSPAEIVNACASQYRIDKWANQVYRPAVWIEKDALVGVIENVCNQYDVPYFSCRGYTSQSEMWNSAQNFRQYMLDDQTPIILHLGDHDPSGIDMTRDIIDRMELFRAPIVVKRLALNYDQVEKYNPPPNPAKSTDTRYSSYIKEYGHESWELDALEPKVISDLIEKNIVDLMAPVKWQQSFNIEKRAKNKLKKIAKEIK